MVTLKLSEKQDIKYVCFLSDLDRKELVDCVYACMQQADANGKTERGDRLEIIFKQFQSLNT